MGRDGINLDRIKADCRRKIQNQKLAAKKALEKQKKAEKTSEQESEATSIRKVETTQIPFTQNDAVKVTVKGDITKMCLFAQQNEEGNFKVESNGYSLELKAKEADELFQKAEEAINNDKTQSSVTLDTGKIKELPISETEYKSIKWETKEDGKSVTTPNKTKDCSIQVMNDDGTIRLVSEDAIKKASEKFAPKNGAQYEPTTGEKIIQAAAAPFVAVGTVYNAILGDHDGRASEKIGHNPWGTKTLGVAGEVASVGTDTAATVFEQSEKLTGAVSDATLINNVDENKTTTNAFIDVANSVSAPLRAVTGVFQATQGGLNATSSVLKAEDSTNAMLEKVRDKALENIKSIELEERGTDENSRQMLALINNSDTPIIMLKQEAFARQLINKSELDELSKKSDEEVKEAIKAKLNYLESVISDKAADNASALFSIGFRLGLTKEQMEGKSYDELRTELARQKGLHLGVFQTITPEKFAAIDSIIKNEKGEYKDPNVFNPSDLSDTDLQKFIDLGMIKEEVILLAHEMLADEEIRKLSKLIVEQRDKGVSDLQNGITKTSEELGNAIDIPSNIIKVVESTNVPVVKEVGALASGAIDTATGAVGTVGNAVIDAVTFNWNFSRTKKSASKTADGAIHAATLGHETKPEEVEQADFATNYANNYYGNYKKEDGSLSIPVDKIKNAKHDKKTGLWIIGETLLIGEASYQALKDNIKKAKEGVVNIKSEDMLPKVTDKDYISKAKLQKDGTYKISTGWFTSEIIRKQEYAQIIANYNSKVKEEANKIEMPFDKPVYANKTDKFISEGYEKFYTSQAEEIDKIMKNGKIPNEQKNALLAAQFRKAITEQSLTEEHRDKTALIIAAKIAENDKNLALSILTGAYECKDGLNDGELGILKRSMALIIGPIGRAGQALYEHPVLAAALIPALIAAPGWTYASAAIPDTLSGTYNTLHGSFNDQTATYETTRILKPFWWHHGHDHHCGDKPIPKPEDPWCTVD